MIQAAIIRIVKINAIDSYTNIFNETKDKLSNRFSLTSDMFNK